MKKVIFKNVKVNEVFSETQFYKVEKIKDNQAQLVNEAGEKIVVDSKYVETCLTSAEQFETVVKATKTELANYFLHNKNVALTVNFNKQVKVTDVTKEIMEAYTGSTPKTMESAIKSAVAKGLEGVERTMTGHHSGSQDEFGRVHFTDMGVTTGHNIRQVDPRTINWLIVNGVKYILK